MHSRVWVEITQFSNVNSAAVEVCEWVSVYTIYNGYSHYSILGLLLLAWFNFNPSMDK